MADHLENIYVQAGLISKKRKIPEPAMPPLELEWPSDLAIVPTPMLGKHLSYWTGLSGYTTYQAAIARSAANSAKGEYEYEFARVYNVQDSRSTTDKTQAATARPHIRKLHEKYLSLDARANILEAMVKAYDANYAAISRELSRRQQEHKGG